MKKTQLMLFIFICACTSVVHAQDVKIVWDFDSLDGWTFGHQDNNPDNQVSIEEGYARIFTRPNSWDRKKIRTNERIYGTGRYTWKIFIPQMGAGDMASVGAWIYHDDEHEIDFEIGHGRQEEREKLGAEEDDLLAYMTTQANPFVSEPVLIKKGWHIFEIDLSLVEGKYRVQWLIDGKLEQKVDQTFGDEYKFHIFCSVENLKFMGDHIPNEFNYGLYDYVEFTPHD